MHAQIQKPVFIPRHQIDAQQWNQVVEANPNGLLYTTTQYLDGVCTNWQALIWGDYEVLMPLPFRRKLGVPYLYQPYGLAQGGLIAKSPVGLAIEQVFLDILCKKFLHIDLALNEYFGLQQHTQARISQHQNFVLPLHKPYAQLYQAYNQDGQRNITKAKSSNQDIKFEADPAEVLQLYLLAYGENFKKPAQKQELRAYAELLQDLMATGLAFGVSSYNASNQLIAAAVFGIYKHRIYYLFGAPSAEGRKLRSIQLILDAVIAQYANSPYVLDFEGSDIPSVANLYQKFGPLNQPIKKIWFSKLQRMPTETV